MSDKYIAKKIELTDTDLYIDGVRLPWHIGRYPEINMEMAPYSYGLEVMILADRVVVEAAHHQMVRDTLLEAAREEALEIVRREMRDVRIWLGEITPDQADYEARRAS